MYCGVRRDKASEFRIMGISGKMAQAELGF
jgi:hypothetical protein